MMSYLVENLRAAFERARYNTTGDYNTDGDLFDAAAAEIERLRAELAARDGEIADWLRTLLHVNDHDGIADALLRGAYRD